MTFGLENAGVTYQRLMDKYFKDYVGRNVKVYVDDIMIKANAVEQLLDDIDEILSTLQSYRLNLYLSKCTFGVQRGK